MEKPKRTNKKPKILEMKKEQQILEIRRKLYKKYGYPENWIAQDDPLDALVAVLLSHNTTDAQSFPAFEELKKRFPMWEKCMNASEAQIKDAIKRCGLANVKAKRIKQILKEINQRQGKLDLTFLCGLTPREAKNYLTSFKGVGPKSAAVVLNFSCKMPLFPVDTHIYRVLQRTGIITDEITREKAHDIMDELVPDEYKTDLHVNIIKLGRETCKAGTPKCYECPIVAQCKYKKKKLKAVT